ncbi:MAG: restriction endonuclease subunit S, partial [Bacteroidales bacterium]|nr:restriction endonuclease subunit S [Bacteroidales bacterium]
SAIKKEFFVPDGYKVYEQGNAINNDPYRGKYFVDEKKYQELINFKALPTDLIVSCSGVTLGRICELPDDAKPGIINQALLRIRLKKDLILSKYFVLHFRGAFFQKRIFDQSQGTAMPNLVGIKDFKEIDMLIPPIKEQQRIVQELESKLTVCDKIEEAISQSLQQAETLRQSILKKAFEGRLIN